MTITTAILRLLRDESGETAVTWMYPFLLLLILVAITSGQVGGQWDQARLRLSSETSFTGLFLRY